MKNSHLPLIQALKNRLKPKEESAGPMDMPRTFELKHNEMADLAGRKVGEGISINLRGHIQSQHSDGRAIMHVANVKPDSSEMTNKENPDADASPKEIRVRTQESVVP